MYIHVAVVCDLDCSYLVQYRYRTGLGGGGGGGFAPLLWTPLGPG